MPWPFTFGTATSPLAASTWDTMFNQVAAGMAIPCSALGTNAISLTPLTNFPALTAYTELAGYRFRAATNTTGATTLQYNGLGLLPCYHADGVTQINVGDITAGFEYVARFSQSLNSGSGGFFLESPALPTAASTWFTPGGRLSSTQNVPVPFASLGGGTSAIWYPPYVHQLCPVYNGTNIQMVNFCSSLSDQTGLKLDMSITPATWPSNTAFDVFMTLIGGIPTLCTVQWTSTTVRNISLAVWGGFLTNNSTTTAQTSSGAISLPVHQGTFLGSFCNTGGSPGICQWTFGGAASGGNPGNLGVCNFYNKVLFTMNIGDSGVNYTYSSVTVRLARGSSNNQFAYMQSDSERAMIFMYQTGENLAAAASGAAATGVGIDTTTAFSYFQQTSNPQGVNGFIIHTPVVGSFAGTGFHVINALEQSDGTNANTFNRVQSNVLSGSVWL